MTIVKLGCFSEDVCHDVVSDFEFWQDGKFSFHIHPWLRRGFYRRPRAPLPGRVELVRGQWRWLEIAPRRSRPSVPGGSTSVDCPGWRWSRGQWPPAQNKSAP